MKNKKLKTFAEHTKNLNTSDVSDGKNFSKNDIIDNIDKYLEDVGFNYDDDIKTKFTKYINWLSSKI